MDTKQFMQPRNLERYSFHWSQVRLIIAAIALIIGGIPPILFILPFPALFGIIAPLLKVSWIVSGVASAYLLWRWNTGNRKVFGGTARKDTFAFFVSVISGLNLGIMGLVGNNIGMSISQSKLIFVIVAIIYLLSFFHLQMRWKAYGKKIF